MVRVSIGALGSALVLVLVVLVLVAAPGLSAQDAGELPLRKAGRWEMKTVMDEGFGPREQVITMCIDTEMERTTATASKADHAEKCSKYEVKRAGDTTTVDAHCVFDGRTVESVTRMSGDFQSAFNVTIDSTTSGTERGQSISVKRSITQAGKYLGESCGDLEAGEAMGSDGHKILVQ
jgi:hypothetical protein